MRVFVAILIGASLVGAQTLPDGPGKDSVESVCTDCHTVERIAKQHLSEESWRNIIREMTENGAAFGPDDSKAILEYLTKNFGPQKIKINEATVTEIASMLKLSTAEAEAIVQYRTANGKFHSVDELKKIAPKAEAVRDKIEF